MNNMLLKLYVKFQDLQNGEEGQDLIEYALLAALLSLAVFSSVGGVATALETKFNTIATSITSAG